MSKVFEKAKRFIASLAEGNDAERALKRQEVEKFIRSTSGHRPGDIHVLSDGTRYQVQSSGAWVKL